MKIDDRLCRRPGNGVPPEAAPKIDPEIRRMVEILNSKGLETELSCAGHQDRQEMFCHYGYITIRPRAYHRYLAAKARGLKAFLRACPQVYLVMRYFSGPRSPVRAQPVFVFYIPSGRKRPARWRQWEDAAERFL